MKKQSHLPPVYSYHNGNGRELKPYLVVIPQNASIDTSVACNETSHLVLPASGAATFELKNRENKKRGLLWRQASVAAIVGLILFLLGIWAVEFSSNLRRRQRQSNDGREVQFGITNEEVAVAHHPGDQKQQEQDDSGQNILMCTDNGHDSNNGSGLKQRPCFTPSKIVVRDDRLGFPSFWRYANQGHINVTYDNRSILINGDRALFLSGSLHPVRGTRLSWNYALDEAVRNGLNMVTIYIMWQYHQPFEAVPIDWHLSSSSSKTTGTRECSSFSRFAPSCEWDIASAIRAAANRGLFVHIRIGPYVCAEYNYGGIPEWVALNKPNMSMRRPNRLWMNAMEVYVEETIDYLTKSQLWAYQGGPIIMAQIENELGGNIGDPVEENYLLVDTNGSFVDRRDEGAIAAALDEKDNDTFRNATLQDYADWCGHLAQRLAPNVIWTMCSGLAANNTILTCNGDCSTWWLENHGGTGRIQVDQPAILTEFEGGFQIWGESPNHPSDYFWGQTARRMARDALQWFARGGTHLNYYMWWGGYNTGREAAAGIMNKYASDAVICPSGERRQPKFGHFESLHRAIADIAPTLLTASTALAKPKAVKHLKEDGGWVVGKKQRLYEYNVDSEKFKQVAFVENDSDYFVAVEIPDDILGEFGSARILHMLPQSVTLLVDGEVRFDSASIVPRAMSYERKYRQAPGIPSLLDWSVWPEPIGTFNNDSTTRTSNAPIEQTDLNMNSMTLSDYAWYETDVDLENAVGNATVSIDTQKATAFLLFVDGTFVGAVDQHFHSHGPIVLSVGIGSLSKGSHTISILSESLGYGNLIGRWGAETGAKTKGITGDVILHADDVEKKFNMSLVDGRSWQSFPGLHGEAVAGKEGVTRESLSTNLMIGHSSSPTWSSALFDTPRYDPSIQSLFLHVTNGRGHLWLNGFDLGRYWNITQAEAPEAYSQEYYFLPYDYLQTGGNLNEIVLFDAFGSNHRSSSRLVLSWIEAADDVNLFDEIDYPSACL